ncbi:MAG: DUF2059 domain-containing protein, partial [Deltaproteobacteria bacterium]
MADKILLLEEGMRLKKLLLIIIVSWLPFTVYAQIQNDAQIQALYVKSGLDKQLEQLPLVIQASFEQASQADKTIQKLPGNIISIIKTSIREAFNPASLKAAMLTEIRENLAAQDIEEVLDWLDSPLGKKCTKLEEAASTPDAFAKMQQYAARIQKSPPTAKRLNILQKLDSAVKGTESGVDIAINCQVAVALATVSTLPSEQQRSLKDISRELEKNRPQLEAMVRSQVLLTHLYTYRNLTDDEIQQYIEFASSPAGSKYHSVTGEALKKAFYAGSIRWGKSIGEAMKQMQHQS